MVQEPKQDDGGFPNGFAIPITGLLAFLFALMAGMSVYPVLSGSPGDIAIPLVFGAASIVCFRLRQRYVAARETE